MQAIGFKLVEATNPTNGEIVKKVRCAFDNGKELNLLTDLSIDDIKKDRDALLATVIVATGEYGDYCRFRRVKVLEEF